MRHTFPSLRFEALVAASKSHSHASLADKAVLTTSSFFDMIRRELIAKPFKTLFLTAWTAFFLGLLARG